MDQNGCLELIVRANETMTTVLEKIKSGTDWFDMLDSIDKASDAILLVVERITNEPEIDPDGVILDTLARAIKALQAIIGAADLQDLQLAAI